MDLTQEPAGKFLKTRRPLLLVKTERKERYLDVHLSP